jgi:hypothetical protein
MTPTNKNLLHQTLQVLDKLLLITDGEINVTSGVTDFYWNLLEQAHEAGIDTSDLILPTYEWDDEE